MKPPAQEIDPLFEQVHRVVTERRNRGGVVFAEAVALALLLVAALLPARGADSSDVAFPGSIRAVDGTAPTGHGVRKAFVSRSVLTSGEKGATVEFEVALKMRNFDELQQRVAKGERISPEEMAQKYEPTAEDEQAVVDWLTRKGLTISHRNGNRLAVFAQGTVGQVEHALQTNFARVTSENVDYTSAITDPKVPSAIAPLIVGINGLQPHLRAHKHAIVSGSAPYTPTQIGTAYDASGLYAANVTGAGQTIAIVIDTLPLASDLTAFWQYYGVNQSINNVSFIQVIAGTLPTDTSEATLDTEWASSMAPGAQVRVYATKSLISSNLDQAYEQIYNDATKYGIHQVSLSYSGGELTDTTSSQLTSESQIFATLASAGITVFCAAGDGASTPDNTGGTTGPTQVQYPASDPNVTGVGGTTLRSSYYTGGQNFEYGWSLGGGGTSSHFTRPSYQSGVAGMPAGSARCVPDVSCTADPNYGGVVTLNGQHEIYGGTSLSTPIWAGFCALINQARATAGLSSIGGLNSSLYPLLGTSSFTDITSGNNGYAAGSGYDLVTGIGVPSMQNLIAALAPGFQLSPLSILHNFSDGSVTNDGQGPVTGLVKGTDGNFYGTTPGGGANFQGAVYKITPQGVTTILYSFNSVSGDGAQPEAGLVQGTDGNFYGTTEYGGSAQQGTVFKVTPQGVETVLHSFNDGSVPGEGENPRTALMQASDGNFYGATGDGGANGTGTLFGMTPSGGMTTLYTFPASTVFNNGSGANQMIQGPDGNLYGTTTYNGAYGGGMVYKMTLQGVLTTLHSFGDPSVPNSGGQPQGALVVGSDGNFYGTTEHGGSVDAGTIFQMTPQGAVTTFHNFEDGSVTNDGSNPMQGLIHATDGNFYGTTASGGSGSDGTVFRMTPQGVVTLLHHFNDGSVPGDGTSPQGGVTQGTDGNFYGTTNSGGTGGSGTVFKLQGKSAPVITSANSATFTTNLAGSFTVTATGNPTPTLSARNLPSWASFNASNGVLSGTPTTTTGAPYALVFTANNGFGGLAAQTFTLNVQNVTHTAPAITNSSLAATAVIGTAYSFTYQTTGSPTPSFSLASGSLPVGLSLSPAGVISGTPLQSGTFTGTVTASNGVGTAATQSFSLTVTAPPQFIGGSPPAGTVGTAFSFTFAAAGSPSPTFSLTQGTLPAGMNLTAGGLLSGTPTVSGEYDLTVTATNSVGTDSLDFAFDVDQAAAFTSSAPTSGAPVNQAYSFSLAASGFPAPTFAVTAGALPPGISLSGGVLSGTPYQTGTYTGTITASNGVGSAATQNFTIVVSQTPVFNNGVPPPTLVLGTAYNFSYQIASYPAATFTLGQGSLPPGVSLSSAGVLSGTPTQAGTYSFVVSVNNGITTVNQDVTLTVYTNGPPVITNGPPPATGSTRLGYAFTYQTSSYPIPTFAVTSGSLPPGLTLSSSGVISGLPTQAGTYTGVVTATNGNSPAATQPFTIVIIQSAITYTILHNFQDGTVTNDGSAPLAGMIQGPDGNYYGVTASGGFHNTGVVFKIAPAGAVSTLYSFGTGNSDGESPSGTLVLGADGNFYGTTQSGGNFGQGLVFKVTPQGTESIVYAFGSGGNGLDGNTPFGALTLGADGNFYGTTTSGGSNNQGIVFKLTPEGVETVLHNFGDGTVTNDGSQPRGSLIQARDGNFYGMTTYGGSAGEGTVFTMTPAGTVTILHSFGDGSISQDGATPLGGLIQGSDGNLYGLTELGGIFGSNTTFGTYFRITTAGTMTMLHRFGDGTTGSDAIQPWDNLVLGPDGNFYGTSYYGGTTGYGSVFSASTEGTVTILHSFNSGTPSPDGANPTASLVFGTDGNLYGNTNRAGSSNGGEIFRLSLSSPPFITSANTAIFTAGHASSFTFTATGNPASTFSATGLPSWASLNAATGVLSGTPPDTTGAPFTLTITAANGVAPNATQSFTLNVLTSLNFSEWEASFPHPVSSDMTTTLWGDSVPNLLKYVFDINPGAPMSATDRAALPTFERVVGDTTYLTLTYREYRLLDPSVTVSIQTSSDLQNWTNLPAAQTATATTCTLQQIGTDTQTGDPIMQATVLPNGSRQFLRLQVSP